MSNTALPAIGTYSRVRGTDPAANTEIALTVPAEHSYALRSLTVPLVQGATQTPQPILVIDEGLGSTTSLGTVTVTIATPGVFTRVAHGLIAGELVYLTKTGALPTGLASGTLYYVIAAGLTANEFQVSATRAGSAINTSGTQSGVHTLWHSAVLYEGFGCSAAQGVNTTCRYTWSVGLELSGLVGATTNVHATAALPDDLILPPGARVITNTVGLGANSDYAAPSLVVYDMFPV